MGASTGWHGPKGEQIDGHVKRCLHDLLLVLGGMQSTDEMISLRFDSTHCSSH